MAKKVRYWRDNQVKTLKPGVNRKKYEAKYPDAQPITTPQPSIAQMEEWENERGGCEALDGCFVEMDGHCPHGLPSWALALGLI
jgi:hypothetical protein